MPICQLCGEVKPLVDAHVIPRGFWDLPEDQRKPLAMLGSKPGWTPKRSLVGEYDSEILCQDCDNKLGVFDQHAIEQLMRKSGEPIPGVPFEAGRQYPGASPAMMHHFVTSVAWRASKSRRDFFGRVKLGPYESLILESIASNTPCYERLSCFIAEFDVDGVPFLNPQYNVMESVKFLVIFASKFTFYLKVDKRPMPEMFKRFEIDERRNVYTIVRNWTNSRQFDAVLQLVRSNPKPRFWSS